MRGNPDNLRRAATAKSAAAQARAEQGLREMVRRDAPITFRGLAQIAGVSLDFLYRNTEIRRRVEQLRNQQRSMPPPPPDRADPDQPSSVVRTLTAQLTNSNAATTRKSPRCGGRSRPPTARTSNSDGASAVLLPRIERRTEKLWRSC